MLCMLVLFYGLFMMFIFGLVVSFDWSIYVFALSSGSFCAHFHHNKPDEGCFWYCLEYILIDNPGGGCLNVSLNFSIIFGNVSHVCAALKPGHFVPFPRDEKLLSLKKKVEVESESAFSGDNIFSNTPCSRCCSCGARKK